MKLASGSDPVDEAIEHNNVRALSGDRGPRIRVSKSDVSTYLESDAFSGLEFNMNRSLFVDADSSIRATIFAEDLSSH
jgi:hypothetical protein